MDEKQPCCVKETCQSLLGIFKAPCQGALTALWLGLILVMFSFTIKHMFVSWGFLGASCSVEKDRLEAKKAAKLDDLSLKAKQLQLEIDEINDELSNTDNKDKKTKLEEKKKKLEDKQKELWKEQAKEKKELDKEYDPLIDKAENHEKWAKVSFHRTVKWGFWFKFFLDILKVLGFVFIIFSSLHIVSDPNSTTPLKVYAIVLSGITLFSCVFGTIFNFLS